MPHLRKEEEEKDGKRLKIGHFDDKTSITGREVNYMSLNTPFTWLQLAVSIYLLFRSILKDLMKRQECKKFKEDIRKHLERIDSNSEMIKNTLKKFSGQFNKLLNKLLCQEVPNTKDIKENFETELYSLNHNIILFYNELKNIKIKLCYYAKECLKSPKERADFRIKIEDIDKQLRDNLDLWPTIKRYACDSSFKQALIDIGLEAKSAEFILQIIRNASIDDIMSIEMLKNFRENFKKVVTELIEAGRPYQF
ncbi:MAG: hypothetical protein DRJ30_05455 [Candidatus Methanomethylicota archaeon]|nr:MAG: hypothetical protein DRJ30_05455 [Candidatus Verstraetearchaeota archaeon]